MRILKIEAVSFGKLSGLVLEPGEGLNVYTHPNEFGKTTLIAFICYMFYGYDARTMKGYLPWNGEALAGSLTFEQGGEQWQITRRRKAAEKRQLFNLTTGKERVLGAKEQPGELFFGLKREAFMRSFCIAQGDLLFAQADGLDTALKNMTATGEENVSFARAEAWLLAEHTKYKHSTRERGHLIELEQSLAEDRNTLALLQQELDGEILQQKELQALNTGILQGERTLAELRQRLKRAEGSDALRMLQKIEALKQTKPMDPPAVSRDLLEEQESAFEAAERAKVSVAAAEEEKDRIEDQLQLVNENAAQFGFHDLSGQDLAKLQKSKKLTWQWILPGIGLPCLIASFFVAGQWDHLLRGIGFACVLVFGILVFLLVQRRKRICHSYGAANEQQLQEKWLKYQQVLEQREALKNARKAAGEALEQAKAIAGAAAEHLDRLRSQTHLFDLNDLRRMQVEWGIYEARKNESPAVLQEDALLNGRSRAELEQLAAGAVLQEETAAQVRALLEAAEQEDRVRRHRREQMDPYRLEALWQRHQQMEEQVQEKEARLALWKKELEAVQTAMEWLGAANEEMSTRFAPRLCALAGEHLAKMTAGKYTTLLMDEGYNISLQSEEGIYPLSQFSAGTRDAVYFAFRLAVSSLLSREILPMVLDDPFVNLDPARLREAESLLEKAGENRQILYFKCR